MLHTYLGDLDTLFGVMPSGDLSTVKTLYPQGDDWTCALACFRTLLTCNGITVTEADLISICAIKPGPKSSAEVEKWSESMGLSLDIRYGWDNAYINTKPAQLLHELIHNYNVMIELLLNYAHWVVVLAYYKMGTLDEDVVVIYDPYFNQVRQFHASEVFAMWYGIGDGTYDHDYVAVIKNGGR